MEQGLTSAQVQELQTHLGKNEITDTAQFSAIKLFLSQFPTAINGILMLAAVFSFVINQPLDAILILAILVLMALLSFFQEFKAEKALEKLKTLTKPMCVVRRNGKTQEEKIENLVVGDVVLLTEGDTIPADGIVSSFSSFEADESILSGESLPIVKKKGDMLFRGSYISKGKATITVNAIGNNTKLGKIAQTLGTIKEEKTPLQIKIIQLTRWISFIAMILSAFLLPIGIYHHKSFYPLLLVAISIAIAAIPESLPAVITIALALGTNRMAQRKAIVRKLSSIETIGAVQVILTDKTGTLTQNKMNVKKYFCPEKENFHDLVHACMIGNTAHIVEEKGKKEIIGDKTDGALLLWAKNQDVNTQEKVEHEKAIILDEYTFNPKTKTITTVANIHDRTAIFVKGAPESIFAMSKLTKEKKGMLEKACDTFASEGMRIIAFAQKYEPQHKKPREELESNLSFLGFLCLYDPPREEAKHAVEAAKKAGIMVVMVTGDNPLTAKAIAKDVGILDGDTTVMTGKELSTLNDQELMQALEHVHVFARTTAEDKLRLVTAFQVKGLTVGVTGDGVNDALALKKANVGLAMGQKGTDVAKEASDIVLADDNFSTIIAAVDEGRKIYANIVNALTYLITGNLIELLLILFASVLNFPSPQLPIQILWINLVSDGLPALTLANDKGGKYLLDAEPREREEPLISNNRLLFMAIASIITTIFLLWIFNFVNLHYSLIKARTVTFGLTVFIEMILAIIIRGKQIFSNKFFYLSIALIIFLQLIITFVPIFQSIFHLSI